MLERRWVVMGVSGCGKSTLGRLWADHLGLPFIEGDDEHPPENIAKMASGHALDDADRLPWLLRLQARIAKARESGSGLVLTCSALKRQYRDLLRSADPQLILLHLHGTPALLAQRLAARRGHFAPASLLESQLRDLEPLASGEAGLRLDSAQSPAQWMEQLCRAFPECA